MRDGWSHFFPKLIPVPLEELRVLLCTLQYRKANIYKTDFLINMSQRLQERRVTDFKQAAYRKTQESALILAAPTSVALNFYCIIYESLSEKE
jgi:hypothetical protein